MTNPMAGSSPRCRSEDDRRSWEQAWAEVKDLPTGEGLNRAFGAWADDAEQIDRFLEWNHAQRRLGRRPLP